MKLIDKFIDTFSEDRVPNVRFNLIKTMEIIKEVLSQQYVASRIVPAFEKLRDDEDVDVSYFARQGIKNIA